MPLEVVDVCDDDGVSGANLREKGRESGLFLFQYSLLRPPAGILPGYLMPRQFAASR
jgi:hypothetical protein